VKIDLVDIFGNFAYTGCVLALNNSFFQIILHKFRYFCHRTLASLDKFFFFLFDLLPSCHKNNYNISKVINIGIRINYDHLYSEINTGAKSCHVTFCFVVVLLES